MIKRKYKILIAIGLLLFFAVGLHFVIRNTTGLVKISDKPAINVDGYLAENIIHDSSTGRYWWVFSDRNVLGIRLASSPDMIHWEVEKDLLIEETPLDSVCIRRFGGKWYLYYAKHFGERDLRANIWMRSSNKINSGYSDPMMVLDTDMSENSWDYFRVSEPDIVWKDGKYFLFYMGESKDKYEKIGYAVSNSPSGPFEKYINNPVLSGSDLYELKWNSGHDRAADPYVFQIEEGYIIQHTACKMSKRNWSIGWAFTKDFISFKVFDIPILTTGIWAEESVSRGGIIKINDKYFMSFAGQSASTEYGKCGLIEIANFNGIVAKILNER